MSIGLLSFFSLSIFIAGIIAAFRFKKINKIYYPFLYIIWIGCLSEIISLILANNKVTSYVNNNIYVLIESILFAVLFKNFALFNEYRKLFYATIASLIFVWIVENFVFGHFSSFNIYFSIYYSFMIVLMSITIINKMIVRSMKNIFKNATFLLCIVFVIYFTFQVLIFAFWIYGSKAQNDFLLKLFSIMIFINLLTNLIYSLIISWMPRKLEFTLPL
jgi:hypothetical protein